MPFEIRENVACAGCGRVLEPFSAVFVDPDGMMFPGAARCLPCAPRSPFWAAEESLSTPSDLAALGLQATKKRVAYYLMRALQALSD